MVGTELYSVTWDNKYRRGREYSYHMFSEENDTHDGLKVVKDCDKVMTNVWVGSEVLTLFYHGITTANQGGLRLASLPGLYLLQTSNQPTHGKYAPQSLMLKLEMIKKRFS